MLPPIELLAPAKDRDCGVAAIDCGADALYVGGPRFGAREAAGNTLDDIAELVHYAHRYWVRVYAAVNTLLHDDELAEAERQCWALHRAGVDGLIIQDVGLLETDLPPLPLIASTQMHNASPERVAFWQKVGFSRVILARELDLDQIRAVRAATDVELEVFVHGALCVSMSGQCGLSYALGGRSGNRGQCAQPCRRLYTLQDATGKTLVRDKHLLSLRDLNLTDHLAALIHAGVTSFKIEGRLKNKAYVMNIVSHYRKALDALGVRRCSSGTSEHGFSPDPNKTFNRGYTSYFLEGRGRPVTSPDSPKHVGESIGRVTRVDRDGFSLQTEASLHSGDGISFFGRDHELRGTVVNQVQGEKILPEKLGGIERGVRVFRNHDHAFVGQLQRSRNQRRIAVRLCLGDSGEGLCLRATDEDGVSAVSPLGLQPAPADKPEQARQTLERQLAKLGDSEFFAVAVEVTARIVPHLPVSVVNGLRRSLVEELRAARARQRLHPSIVHLANEVPFPEKELSFLGNVLNQKAEAFYRRHGVKCIEPAAESGLDMRGRRVMLTRMCIKYELGFCSREGQRNSPEEPWILVDDAGHRFRLRFHCEQRDCLVEMIYEP